MRYTSVLLQHAWRRHSRPLLLEGAVAARATTCGAIAAAARRALATSVAAQCAPPEGGNRVVDLGPAEQFQPGELRAVESEAGRPSVLVANVNGELFCTGNTCTHYGASLNRGVLLCGAKAVACPWHAAIFDLRTGRPLSGPGLKGIPVYPVAVTNGRLSAIIPKDIEECVDLPMASEDPASHEVVGIVGAGAAAVSAAETLRETGYRGHIVMFGQESYPPYDRTLLSKQMVPLEAKLTLRSVDWLRDVARVEFKRDTHVTAVDTQARTITTQDGTVTKCDKILLATGADPRRLNVPGSGLQNIFTLRYRSDHEQIGSVAAPGKHVVIVGGSFIGTELATTLIDHGLRVTIIAFDNVPLQRVFGTSIGGAVRDFLVSRGVVLHLGQSVARFHGTPEGVVSEVELGSGERVPADFVIAGIGVIPNTDYVRGVPRLSDRSLEVNAHMEVVNTPGVFAAGDIATFPYYKTGELARIEHWNVATQQGRVAALNMAGLQQITYAETPYFWTKLLGRPVRYAGYCKTSDDINIEGNLGSGVFTATFLKGGAVHAVISAGRDPEAVAVAATLDNETPLPSLDQFARCLACVPLAPTVAHPEEKSTATQIAASTH